jgi:UDP-N-acetylglucosamine acyltransferase
VGGAKVHPSAVVHPGARLASDVEVGPFAVIGEHVVVGAGCRIGAHVVIDGHTSLGKNNQVHPFACLGGAPQDKKYAGEPTQLVIGDGNTIREYVTINTGTVQDGGVTTLGDDNWIMAYVHVAHDCHLGSHIILANAVQLAGHVHLGDWVFLGGLTGVHQFVRVGDHAMAGFQSRLSTDVPPFVTVAGNPSEAVGINAEGLKRRGFDGERIMSIKRMYKLLYRNKDLSQAQKLAQLQALRDDATALPLWRADTELMLGFVSASTRGVGQ